MQIHYANYTKVPDTQGPWGPRRLLDFEVILALRGEFFFENLETGEKCRQTPGDVLTIYPDELHTYRKSSPGSGFFSCIHFDPKSEDRPERLVQFPAEHAIVELFRRITALYGAVEVFQKEQVGNLLQVLWLDLLNPPQRERLDSRLDGMIQYLEEHLTEHPTRLDLAARFFVTPQRINAIFQQGIGVSPGEYVHKELAARGYRLLHDRQYSVKQTAHELGFDNPFYFSRVFKKIFGFPPCRLIQVKRAPR